MINVLQIMKVVRFKMGESGGAHDPCLPQVNQPEHLDCEIGYQKKREGRKSHEFTCGQI